MLQFGVYAEHMNSNHQYDHFSQHPPTPSKPPSVSLALNIFQLHWSSLNIITIHSFLYFLEETAMYVCTFSTILSLYT